MGNAVAFSGFGDKSYQSAYDLYAEGNSYSEIAAMLGLNLFEVMRDVAEESKAHIKHRLENPLIEIEFVNNQLRKVIREAWTMFQGSDEKVAGQYLSIITNANRQIVANLKMQKEMRVNENDDANVSLPAGLTAGDLKDLGKMAVQQRFPRPRPVV